MESMQLLLRDARQHATDVQADNTLLQQSQDRLHTALAEASIPTLRSTLALPYHNAASQ